MSRPMWSKSPPAEQDLHFNDPGTLSQASESIGLEKPQTNGGVLVDGTNNTRQYVEFNTHTPPDITPNTRVIAICGISPEYAAPDDDGWYLSDFFAFYHLFHGLTPNQSWIHGLDLQKLVDTHKQYLHGDPFKKRKVVLDRVILDRATQAQDLCPRPMAQLRSTFRTKLESEAKAASEGDQDLLVLIFAHGDKKNGGMQIGEGLTFKQDDFSKLLAGLDVTITIMSNACWSGGWTCNKQFDKLVKMHYSATGQQFNKTTMMAAGPDQPSRSWTSRPPQIEHVALCMPLP